ncbi:MAG: hypothetical protein D6768_18300 [Chloroflexi bacterium]|nr:MAG: hypothetical protein D6768_18300 [Chloroflexota bacterium]
MIWGLAGGFSSAAAPPAESPESASPPALAASGVSVGLGSGVSVGTGSGDGVLVGAGVSVGVSPPAMVPSWSPARRNPPPTNKAMQSNKPQPIPPNKITGFRFGFSGSPGSSGCGAPGMSEIPAPDKMV